MGISSDPTRTAALTFTAARRAVTDEVQQRYVDSVQYMTSREQREAYAQSEIIYECDELAALQLDSPEQLADTLDDRAYAIQALDEIITNARTTPVYRNAIEVS